MPKCISTTSARPRSCSAPWARSGCNSTRMPISGGCSCADRGRRPVMSGLTSVARWRFWLAAAGAFVLILWLLNDILLPFVVGAVVAYFFDPVVARLERHGLSRTWATATVTVLAVLIA